jgi:hypothetical protein
VGYRAIFLIVVTLAVAGPVRGHELDSLDCRVEDGAMTLGFLFPVATLPLAELEKVLEDQGLLVEVRVSIEVRKQGRFLSSTFVMTTNVRTLAYSRWYDEFVLNENAKEILTSRSYYGAVDSFRRYDGIEVAETGILEPDADYRIIVDVKGRLRLPEVGGAGESLSLAGLSLPLELADRLRKKNEVFSIRTQSEKFSGRDVPARLFLDMPQSGSNESQSRPRS